MKHRRDGVPDDGPCHARVTCYGGLSCLNPPPNQSLWPMLSRGYGRPRSKGHVSEDLVFLRSDLGPP